MQLTELAYLVDAPVKWVLNTLRALEPGAPYADALAHRLAVTRAVHLACGMPLADAYALAERVLDAWTGSSAPVTMPLSPADDVAMTIDVYRVLSSLQVRRAWWLSSGRRGRGRPRTRTGDALARAADWGLDLTLLRDNLRKSPVERLRQLDAMEAFRSRARRTPRPPLRSTTDRV